MKAIMISIKPRWCAKIMNGEKTIEVRKNKALAKAIQKLIDEYGYADIYVYCSKNEYLYRTNKGYFASKKPLAVGKGTEYTFAYSDEGKVVFKFRCYKVEHFEYDTCSRDICGYWLDNGQVFKNKGTCLSADELWNYIKGKEGYAINISDLEIFDEPKELSEFWKIEVFDKCDVCHFKNHEQDCCLSWKCRIFKRLTKAPQNFCYLEVEE